MVSAVAAIMAAMMVAMAAPAMADSSGNESNFNNINSAVQIGDNDSGFGFDDFGDDIFGFGFDDFGDDNDDGFNNDVFFLSSDSNVGEFDPEGIDFIS